MGSFPNSNLDNLLLQTLMGGMGRLQIRPPTTTNPFFSQSLEDLLFLDDDDDDNDLNNLGDDVGGTTLAREEARLEREIVRLILSGHSDLLRPNSGQAVTVADHHVCVGFHLETGSDYRVWEWHGHIMLFDDDNGYTPEYIYGNYFERLPNNPNPHSSSAAARPGPEKAANLGLRELIEDAEAGQARVLHRNINAASPRV